MLFIQRKQWRMECDGFAKEELRERLRLRSNATLYRLFVALNGKYTVSEKSNIQIIIITTIIITITTKIVKNICFLFWSEHIRFSKYVEQPHHRSHSVCTTDIYPYICCCFFFVIHFIILFHNKKSK